MQRAQVAITYANVLGKGLNSFNNSLSVDEAKRALGLGSAAFEDASRFVKVGTESVGGIDTIACHVNNDFFNGEIILHPGSVSYFTLDPTSYLKSAVSYANNSIRDIVNYDFTEQDVSQYIKITRYYDDEYHSRDVYFDLNETAVFNYVSDNMWETYK